MKKTSTKGANGAVMIFALVTIALMAILSSSLIKTGLFHQRLTTNTHLDALTFLAAESVIDASIEEIVRSEVLHNQLLMRQPLETCMNQQQMALASCDSKKNGTGSNANDKSSEKEAMAARASTSYQGDSMVPGFSSDTLVYQRFSTEGRAYFSNSALPFGHLNTQVWQIPNTGTSVFHKD